MIIYDRVLTEQERVEVEQYLMSKWFAMLFTPDAKVLDFGPGADVGTIVSNAARPPLDCAVRNECDGAGSCFRTFQRCHVHSKRQCGAIR